MDDTRVTYVSPETFDWLMERLNAEPKTIASLRKLMNRPSPFEDEPPRETTEAT